MRTVAFLAQHAQIVNFTKNLLLRNRISCHNLFLLGKKKPAKYLTLQEDHNVSIYGLFYFGPVGPIMKISSKSPQKGQISSLFLLKFNQEY